MCKYCVKCAKSEVLCQSEAVEIPISQDCITGPASSLRKADHVLTLPVLSEASNCELAIKEERHLNIEPVETSLSLFLIAKSCAEEVLVILSPCALEEQPSFIEVDRTI